VFSKQLISNREQLECRAPQCNARTIRFGGTAVKFFLVYLH